MSAAAPMPSLTCELCGASPASEVSGRGVRIDALKRQRAIERSSAVRGELADRIIEEILEAPVVRCSSCVVCGCCRLRPADGSVLPCQLCKGSVCINCSLPALRLNSNGRIVEPEDGSDPGVICSKCNPPTGGRNAGRPWSPVAPELLLPA